MKSLEYLPMLKKQQSFSYYILLKVLYNCIYFAVFKNYSAFSLTLVKLPLNL